MDAPDYEPAIAAWQANPSPATTATLVGAAMPAITRAAARYAPNDPLTVARARAMVVKSLPDFDPKKGKFDAFVETRLRGLTRQTARANAGVKVPDRVAGDRIWLDRAEKELEHELGRSPTAAELADRSGLPVSRMARVRSYRPSVPTSALSTAEGDPYAGPVIRPGVPTVHPLWVDVVYHDLTPTDQKIMELTLGLYGNRPTDNATIAARLGITPSAVSQRKVRIQERLDQGIGLFQRALGGGS